MLVRKILHAQALRHLAAEDWSSCLSTNLPATRQSSPGRARVAVEETCVLSSSVQPYLDLSLVSVCTDPSQALLPKAVLDTIYAPLYVFQLPSIFFSQTVSAPRTLFEEKW
jgi:hypothetical protein